MGAYMDRFRDPEDRCMYGWIDEYVIDNQIKE